MKTGIYRRPQRTHLTLKFILAAMVLFILITPVKIKEVENKSETKKELIYYPLLDFHQITQVRSPASAINKLQIYYDLEGNKAQNLGLIFHKLPKELQERLIGHEYIYLTRKGQTYKIRVLNIQKSGFSEQDKALIYNSLKNELPISLSHEQYTINIDHKSLLEVLSSI